MALSKNIFWSLCLLFLVLAIYFLPLKIWAHEIGQLALAQGIFGVFIYIAVFVLATLLMLPCAFLTLAAGMVYGLWGIPLVIICSCLGAGIAFLISRYFMKNQVETWMQKRTSTRAFKKVVESEGWKFLILLRMSPMIPFNLNNYFLGTVRVRFLTYLWVTALGSLPGTAFYIYLGSIGKNPGEAPLIQWLLLIFGFLASVYLAHFTLKKTRAVLAQAV